MAKRKVRSQIQFIIQNEKNKPSETGTTYLIPYPFESTVEVGIKIATMLIKIHFKTTQIDGSIE